VGKASDLRLYDGVGHEFVSLPGMKDATVNDVAAFFRRHVVEVGEFEVALGEAQALWAERVAARGTQGARPLCPPSDEEGLISAC
jgi:hypothetical protein